MNKRNPHNDDPFLLAPRRGPDRLLTLLQGAAAGSSSEQVGKIRLMFSIIHTSRINKNKHVTTSVITLQPLTQSD